MLSPIICWIDNDLDKRTLVSNARTQIIYKYMVYWELPNDKIKKTEIDVTFLDGAKSSKRFEYEINNVKMSF